MHVLILEPLDFDGRNWPAGVHEVSPADAHALMGRGRVRPATVAEVEDAFPIGVETASARAVGETASLRKPTQRRRTSDPALLET